MFREENSDLSGGDGVAEITIGKQRNGITGTFQPTLRKRITKFENLCRENGSKETMPASSEIQSCRLKPGDRVIRLDSKKRSFLVGCSVQRIPAVIIRVCKRRTRLRVQLPGAGRLVSVHPDNILREEE
jgi:hypothetical protein